MSKPFKVLAGYNVPLPRVGVPPRAASSPSSCTSLTQSSSVLPLVAPLVVESMWQTTALLVKRHARIATLISIWHADLLVTEALTGCCKARLTTNGRTAWTSPVQTKSSATF